RGLTGRARSGAGGGRGRRPPPGGGGGAGSRGPPDARGGGGRGAPPRRERRAMGDEERLRRARDLDRRGLGRIDQVVRDEDAVVALGERVGEERALAGEHVDAPAPERARGVARADEAPVVGQERAGVVRLRGDVRRVATGGEVVPGRPGGEAAALARVPRHGRAFLLVRVARPIVEADFLAVVEEGRSGKREEDRGRGAQLALIVLEVGGHAVHVVVGEEWGPHRAERVRLLHLDDLLGDELGLALTGGGNDAAGERKVEVEL